MKVLHQKIESCLSCPYARNLSDIENTIIACKRGDVLPIPSVYNARVILREPVPHGALDFAIPEWCPLQDFQDNGV